MRNFFRNRTAIQAFLILVIGFLFIQVAGIFVFTQYYSHVYRQVPRHRFVAQFVRGIRLFNLMQDYKVARLKKHTHFLDSDALWFELSNKALPNAAIITSTKPKDLVQFATKHYYSMRASLSLSNKQWLNIEGGVGQDPWLFTGFVVSASILLVIAVLLCFWIVKRLTIPVTEFAQAAKRFGVDVQAPPMAVQGPPEMRQVIEAFNEMQGRLRSLIMDRTQMLAAISHDLRTPITRLQLRIEFLQDSPQYEKAAADLAEMEQMIASILAFARDYVRTEQMEKFDLVALLETACNDLEDTGMAVTYRSDCDRLPYFGRMIALKRALVNLIENAVKYGECADVSSVVRNDKVQIKITDKGSGIPESEMEKVFNPFYRVDASRSPEKSGTGLGMAVARDIIRAHGGEIHLSNGEQGGLVVLVTLPL